MIGLKQPYRDKIDQLSASINILEEEIEECSRKFEEQKDPSDSPTPFRLGESVVIQTILALLTSVALIGLLCYLFVFYASAGDKAFSSTRGSTVEQQLNEIVNHAALYNAWQEGNGFVLMFPFIFLMLAIVTHLCFGLRKWLGLIIVLSVTLLLDAIIAIKISRNIHDDKVSRGLLEAEWSYSDINILAVLLLGFTVSLLLSGGLYGTVEQWKNVRAIRSRSNGLEEDEQDEAQNEAPMAFLQNQIIERKAKVVAKQEEKEGYKTKIDDLSRQQVETYVQGLKAQTDNLQTEIDRLNKAIPIIQLEIKEAQTKYEEVLENQSRQPIGREKIESQVGQFLNGWNDFVIRNTTDEISPQLQRIQEVADETIDQYYNGFQYYSDQDQVAPVTQTVQSLQAVQTD